MVFVREREEILVENGGERNHDDGGNGVTVDDESIIAHPLVERSLRQHVHSG